MRRIFTTHYDCCDAVKFQVVEAAEFFEGQEGAFWVVRPIGDSKVIEEVWSDDLQELDALEERLRLEYGACA